MDNITLYRKYRPQNFDELYGQEHIVKAIKNSLDNDKLSHAYLFNGPRGVGKTTIARLIAKGVNCLNTEKPSEPCNNCENCVEITKGIAHDILEIDAASNRGIDEIRDLKESTGYLPVKCKKKVYIIDEVHMLTKEAFNALLKILEEPPKHIIFILATTEIEKIPDTVISRCQRYDFKTISENHIIELLRSVANKENIQIDDTSLELIYQKSGGSARDSFSIFEQVTSNYINENINYELTEKALGVVPKIIYKQFLELIENKKKEDIINLIDSLWNEGIQIDQFLKDFCSFVKTTNIDIDFKINIISNTLDTLFRFKNEEDKRLLAYIIINKLMKSDNIQSINSYKRIKEKSEIKGVLDNETWQEFIKYINKSGHLKYYQLLKETNIEVNGNTVIIRFKEKNSRYLGILNNNKTINFIEKELYNKYGINIEIITEDDFEDYFKDEIKDQILDIFNAIEK